MFQRVFAVLRISRQRISIGIVPEFKSIGLRSRAVVELKIMGEPLQITFGQVAITETSDMLQDGRGEKCIAKPW